MPKAEQSKCGKQVSTPQQQTPLKQRPHFLASELPQWDGCSLHNEVDRVCQQVESERASTRGVSDKHRQEIRRTTEWLINCLIQCEEAIPRAWLAIGMSSGYYAQKGPMQGQFGYKNVVKKVIPALEFLGWLTIRPGFHDPFGKNGRLTRLRAKGRLRRAIRPVRYCWQAMRPNDNKLILLFEGKGKTKKEIAVPDTPQVDQWRSDLFEFNTFLSKYSISLAVPDSELAVLARRLKKPPADRDFDRRKPVINYRRVQLRRIFTRGLLDRGGRFYGGWWQLVPAEYRPFIQINFKQTIEIDFSSIILTILYALNNQSPPKGDLYDVGIGNNGDSNIRRVVKLYILAILNDEHSGFRLNETQLKIIGTSQSDLKALVLQKHPIIGQHLKTGIGQYLQYLDSQIAFDVMKEMMLSHDVPVLPIHDSFIVRKGFQKMLTQQMLDSFHAILGQIPDVKLTKSKTHPEFASPVDSHGFVQVDRSSIEKNVQSLHYRFGATNPEVWLD